MRHVLLLGLAACVAAPGCTSCRLRRLREQLNAPNGDDQRAAAWKLAKIGEPAIPVFLEATHSDSANLRMIAAERLSLGACFKTRHPEVVERIGQLLGDAHPWVRAAAVRAAAIYCGFRPGQPRERHERNLRDIRPVIPKVLGLLSDEDANVRSNVASRLRGFCRPLESRSVQDLLRPHLQSRDLNVRARAARSAGLAGEADALPILLGCLDEAYERKPKMLREIAAFIHVCSKGSPAALVDALNAEAESPKSIEARRAAAVRRAAAARALGVLASWRGATVSPYAGACAPALDALKKRLKTEKDKGVRQEIEAALEAIKRADSLILKSPMPAGTRNSLTEGAW